MSLKQKHQGANTPANSRAAQSGVALILTLLVVAMLTVVVVGFNSVTRTEQAASRNFAQLHGSDSLAELGLEQATLLLQENVFNRMNSSPAITQPGRAIVGADAREVLLSSAHLVPEADFGSANLNYIFQTNATNNQFASIAYLTNPATHTNYFSVPWVNVTNSDGRLVGRYAFWIDDEGSRLNLNVAGTNDRTSIYPTNARPLAASRLNFPTNGAGLNSTTNGVGLFFNQTLGFGASLVHNTAPKLTTDNETPTWGYYFVPEQIRSFSANTNRTQINNLWNAIQFQVAGGMANMTNRDIAPPALGRYAIDRALNNTEIEAGAFVTQHIDNTTLRSRFANRTFTAKYGLNPLQQIAASILDYPRDPLGGSATGLALRNADGVPTTYYGLSAPPYLNEIAVRPYFAVSIPDGGEGGEEGEGDDFGRIEVQVYVQVELVNPYSTAATGDVAIRFRRQTFDYTGSYTRGGEQYSFSGGRPDWPLSEDVEFLKPLLVEDGVSARSYRSNLYYRYEWQENLEGEGPISDVAVTVNFGFASVQLLGGQGDNANTIRDWAVGLDDLPAWSFVLDPTSDSNSTFVGGGNSGPLATLPAGVSVGGSTARAVAKNDPRVRTFTAWGNVPDDLKAWQPVNTITMGADNPTVNFASGTGIARLPNDRAAGEGAGGVPYFDHPSFAKPAKTGVQPYKSIFDLGRIHTGLQWRTLHMHAQRADESVQYIPDWALLEVLTLTNAWVPVTTRLNPSGLPYPALTGFTDFMQMATNSGGRLSRAGAYAGLLSGFTNVGNETALTDAQVSVGSLTNTVPADLPGGITFTTNDILAISTNLLTMNFSPRWANFRRTNASVYKPGIYSSLGEVVELSGLADDPDLSKADLEGRARVIYESLTPVSDTFTIYSVGEALEEVSVAGVTRTNILGETRLKKQVSWVPRRDAQGAVERDGNGAVRYRLKQGWTLPVITPD